MELQSNLNFQNQNLRVHYITFKFKRLPHSRIVQIARFFLQLGFNSYQQSARFARPFKEPIFNHQKNTFELIFIHQIPHWDGSILQFSGNNATQFYNLIQEPKYHKIVFFELFYDATLGRFDLYYSLTSINKDAISTTQYLLESYQKIRQKVKNVNLAKNSHGNILTVGSRKSNNFLRVYDDHDKFPLKFELEMKGSLLKEYQTLLFENLREKFEKSMATHFFSHISKTLPLEYPHLHWLVHKLRAYQTRRTPKGFIATTYVHYHTLDSFNDQNSFIVFLKFINYVSDLSYKIQYDQDSIPYRRISFRIEDFLKFKEPHIKILNTYQKKKILEFFTHLQIQGVPQVFKHSKFQSLVLNLDITLQKYQRYWTATVLLPEQLFYYKYPFFLPNFLNSYKQKDLFVVQFEFLKVFSSVGIEKKFFIQEFFSANKTIRSNKRRSNMKKHFLTLVQEFVKQGLIQTKFHIIRNGYLYTTQQLTPQNISQGFVIYEKIII